MMDVRNKGLHPRRRLTEKSGERASKRPLSRSNGGVAFAEESLYLCCGNGSRTSVYLTNYGPRLPHSNSSVFWKSPHSIRSKASSKLTVEWNGIGGHSLPQ